MKKSSSKVGKPMPSRARREAVADTSPSLLVKHLAKSLLFTLAAGVILIVIASLCAYFSPDPDAVITPLAIAAAALTAFIGGLIAVRIHGGGALICGLLNGSVFMTVMMLLSLCFARYASGYSAGISCLLHAGFVLLSVVGGYVGNKKKKSGKRKLS